MYFLEKVKHMSFKEQMEYIRNEIAEGIRGEKIYVSELKDMGSYGGGFEIAVPRQGIRIGIKMTDYNSSCIDIVSINDESDRLGFCNVYNSELIGKVCNLIYEGTYSDTFRRSRGKRPLW